MQELVESGKSGAGPRDKYESHAQIDDLTVIFASTTVILVRQTKVLYAKKASWGPSEGEVYFRMNENTPEVRSCLGSFLDRSSSWP